MKFLVFTFLMLPVAAFAQSPTARINKLYLGDAGVTLSNDGDGAITLTGAGNGTDEAITLNLDDTANTAVWSTSTGITLWDLGGMGLTMSGQNVFTLTPRIAQTNLSGGTTLAVNVEYYDTLSADRTLAALPAGTDGDKISVELEVTGATRTINFHTNSTVYRDGTSGALAAAVSFPVGQRSLFLKKTNSRWILKDSGVDTETANFVYAGPTSGGAATPAFRALVAADIPGTALPVATKQQTAAYTVGTTDVKEPWGGVIYASNTGVISLPVIAVGMSVTVIADAAVLVTVDPNGSQQIRLEGTTLAAGFAVKSAAAIGEVAVFTYYDAGVWFCSSATFITNGS